MADFKKLLEKLQKDAGDRDAGTAKEKCPKKRKPALFVMVARSDNADTVQDVQVEVGKPTSQKKPTGGDGMAKFDPAKKGSHVIRLALTDKQTEEYLAHAPHPQVVGAAKTATALLLLRAKPNLEVTVVLRKDATRTPLDDINVVLTGPAPAVTNKEKKSTKPHGIAKFEKLTPGTYTVDVKLTDKQAVDYSAPEPAKIKIVAGKDHKLTLELTPAEANAIRITKLSRWFIPNVESCDIGYALEGRRRTADRLMLEVHASNYCELDSWNDGLPKFKPLTDTPVLTRALGGAFVEEKAAKTIDDWKGLTTCEKGILAPQAEAPHRFLNVACSPYTVHFRYYKDDPADAKARIDLAPFWPQFDKTGAAVADSLKIKFTIKETTKLKLGKLVIWDKDDKVAFTKDLAEGDVSKGDHTIDWDGKTKDGNKITMAGLPYRVQIQAHTKKGELKGLALAAMHTEVRLYVHPNTSRLDLDPYVAANDKSSLTLGLADLSHKDSDPTKDADGKLWTKFALAKAGYHPGPVTDANANAHFNTALAEFQKSVPKHKSPATAPFERLAISTTGDDNADTKTALQNLPANRKRAWFGKAADRSDYDIGTDEFRNDLRDSAKTLIVWVDDRYWYSDPNWLNPPNDDVTPRIRSVVTGHNTALGNDRGAYTIGDTRVTYDARDIARPWIPLQVQFRLLGKTKHLADILTDSPSEPEMRAMREAIGPLRVDWSFDEIDGDTIQVPEVDTGLYNKERSRAKSALEWALNDQKTNQYVRKDVKRKANYFNCPTDNGGLRPKDGANYYKAPFGLDGESLVPWKAVADTGRETLVTVVHDRLGQTAANIFDKKRTGRAGIYFHPSLMAGDGYRVRAQLWFAPHPNYSFANLRMLSQRYPLPPQAHTAGLRLWHKSSVRAYLSWSPNNSWGATASDMKRFYRSAHLHLVNELGISDADVNVPLSGFWNAGNATQLASFRSMVKECVKSTLSAPLSGADPRRTDANISIVASKMWPWANHDQLGVIETTPANPPNPWSAVWDLLKKVADPLFYKYSVRLASELARKVEADRGRMRGHVIVEMQCTGEHFYRKYQCDTCGDAYFGIERTNATTALAGADCRTSGCAGHLQNGTVNWRHHRCANGHDHYWPDDRFAATAVVANCPTCNQALVAQPALTQAATAVRYGDDFPVPSIGNPIGVSFDKRASYELWGHELGHNRYMEHAVNAGGANHDQHDAVANANLPGTEPALSARWDRTCLMAYTNQITGYDAVKDKQMFCFKCLLKNRGWKLAGLNNPPAATADP